MTVIVVPDRPRSTYHPGVSRYIRRLHAVHGGRAT